MVPLLPSHPSRCCCTACPISPPCATPQSHPCRRADGGGADWARSAGAGHARVSGLCSGRLGLVSLVSAAAPHHPVVQHNQPRLPPPSTPALPGGASGGPILCCSTAAQQYAKGAEPQLCTPAPAPRPPCRRVAAQPEAVPSLPGFILLHHTVGPRSAGSCSCSWPLPRPQRRCRPCRWGGVLR